MPQEMFKELLRDIFKAEFKEKNWKKKGQNFIYIGPDGLYKHIYFQKSRWNTKDKLTFYINFCIGLEESEDWPWRRPKHNDGICTIENQTIYSEIREQVMIAIKEIMNDMDRITTKEQYERLW